MADSNGFFPLDKASDTLSPLPDGHRQGLAAAAVFASLSIASCTTVLFYLTYKLTTWHIKTRKEARITTGSAPVIDFNLGLAERHFHAGDNAGSSQEAAPVATNPRKTKPHPNQFLVLIYSLLLADIHQAAAFLLNAVWVSHNGIEVRTSACFAQGWLVSTGDLASSLFITAIAVHTYMALVWNYRPPQRALYLVVVGLWAFNYLLAILGPAMTDNGREHGGFYVRAAAWCWVNVKYETYRLVLHYLYIFMSLVLTSILYILIFLSLRRRLVQQSPQSEFPTTTPHARSQSTASATAARKPSLAGTAAGQAGANPHSSGHQTAFLLYPVIYVVCTAPLALGRIATMAGVKVPTSFFCTAGALIASNGWLDVLLWGMTRHKLLFSSDIGAEDTGLATFTFMRTPPERKYGNMVWVEGAPRQQDSELEEGWGWGRLGWTRIRKRFMGWQRLGLTKRPGTRTRSVSQESLRGMAKNNNDLAIQMDMVTSVVVEVDPKTDRGNSQEHPRKQERQQGQKEVTRQPSAYSMSVTGSTGS
ncbi:G protein-coupled glucose receptor regulating Gpa2-domain-containing protein [Diplogelasinospora grovesii]|uniref:G protein-coupled glucose receptor regulating Gpa2-domain-containing protein n=1 Tax=Diplogelasinospora grovesii TaxID=303347 RepID=A0AAN6S372_9PEZI|nr:G protein-coupled glucose receptor regulating Gpa2-domain-containing protein [Diplogelasinospora grovesii]